LIKLLALTALPVDRCAWCRDRNGLQTGTEGISWCKVHYYRGDTLVQGVLRDFPAITLRHNGKEYRMGCPGDSASGDLWLSFLKAASDELVQVFHASVMRLTDADPWWKEWIQSNYIDPLTRQFFQ
jgi:hypothetical protein